MGGRLLKGDSQYKWGVMLKHEILLSSESKSAQFFVCGRDVRAPSGELLIPIVQNRLDHAGRKEAGKHRTVGDAGNLFNQRAGDVRQLPIGD